MLFSVLAGEGWMPEAGGPQGVPAAPAPVASPPAVLSSIATATGNRTVEPRQTPVDSFSPSGGRGRRMTSVLQAWKHSWEVVCH